MPASPSASCPLIPYGQAHFKGIRQEGSLHVDKTRFIRELAHAEAVAAHINEG